VNAVENGRAELRAVSAAVLAVTAHRSVREILQTIVASARRLLGARYAALGVPADDGSFAEFVVDGISDAQWRAIGPLPRQHGLLGVMLRSRTPQRLADIRKHPSFEGWPMAHPELVDFLGVPIVDGDEILGAVYLANKSGGFTADDEEILELLAAHAAIALVNARLYERGRELTVVEERTRIARELHDAVAQKLFSLRLTADAAAALVAVDPARAAAEIESMRALAADASAELRTVMVGLRPADLAGDGLAGALRKQVALLDRVHQAEVTLVADDAARCRRLSPAREEAAYRVAQEALHNALRHANAGHITVRLASGRRKGITLEVRDDGAGFDPRAPRTARRLGLASMADRARGAGGRLAVTSRPGGGTVVRLEVPGDGAC
jgi:signal transduction histidine kinase